MDDHGEESTGGLTVTQLEQLSVEQKVLEIYRILNGVSPHTKSLMLEIWRDKHIEFLIRGLRVLGPSFRVLDANRPWLCYWILHSIALLDGYVETELQNCVVDFLSRCQDVNGGYGGGPGQLPHLATTYAAVNSLVTLDSQRALPSINRDKMHDFLLRRKEPSGAFRMHDAGEIDVRACYTAISVASVLNMLDCELVQNVGNYIVSCQTYEGGIAGEPGSEAHGGYTFCGLATLILINEAHRLDLPALIDWVVFRQGVECGFQGRTNKLVDGCYSFWQGDLLALVQRLSSIIKEQMKLMCVAREIVVNEDGLKINNSSEVAFDPCGDSFRAEELSDIGHSFLEVPAEWGPLFNSTGLQQYILLCSQVLEGGFKDKPGKARDFYHTCYCLSGLSVCQYIQSKEFNRAPSPDAILGPYSNLLKEIHPLYNVILDQYHNAHEFFMRS